MRRVPDSNYPVRDLFGKGKHGFGPGDKTNGTIATIPGAAFMNAVQEELASIVEAAEIDLDGNDYQQVLKALQIIIDKRSSTHVDSIADLKAKTAEADGQVVIVRGYYTDTPGMGGGLFWGDKSSLEADDGGVVIVANDGVRWRRISESLSVLDFGARPDGVTDNTGFFQSALNYGGVINVPKGVYKISNQIKFTKDGSKLTGSRASKLHVGGNLSDGSVAINVAANKIKIEGLSFVADNRVTIIGSRPADRDYEDLSVIDCGFERHFYAVRIGQVNSDRHFRKILISGNDSTAHSIGNASHFVCSDASHITYSNNKTYGGQNAAAYGAYNCSNVVITGNHEYGMKDLLAGADAAAQIENSVKATITGNNFTHDIWVDDSASVVATGNRCRRLRISVSDIAGQFDDVVFSGNIAAQIHAYGYGSSSPESRMSARFINNLLSPAGVVVNGAAATTAIAVDGRFFKKIELISNNVTSDATTNSLNIVRNAELHLIAKDNFFGARPVLVSSTGGIINQSGNSAQIV